MKQRSNKERAYVLSFDTMHFQKSKKNKPIISLTFGLMRVLLNFIKNSSGKSIIGFTAVFLCRLKIKFVKGMIRFLLMV